MFSAEVKRDGNGEYAKAVTLMLPRFLTEAAVFVQADAKRNVPVDTGNLRGSITRDVQKTHAVIGTNVEYAEHVEYGTRHMQAQPYMRPAIDNNRKALLRRFADMIRRAMEWQR